MKTREKQNKHKLKFDYIAQLQMLGKILKEHQISLDPIIPKTDSNYINEVVKLMSTSKRKEYCSIVDRCDDIKANITKVDESLLKSHQKFSEYKKIILQYKEKT